MADVANSLKSWSTDEASNSPADATTIGAGLADNFQMIQAVVRDVWSRDTIASATTCDLGTKDSGSLTISGTTTITGLGTVSVGIRKWVTFGDALTLTHNGTSLILPGGANITTAAGDTACFESLGSGNWRCLTYFKASAALIVNTLTNTTLTTPTINSPTITSATFDTPINGANGGTGVANTGKTITIGGNVTFSGAYNMQFTVPGAYTYTLPGLTCIVPSEQLQQVSKSEPYTLVLADANKHILHPSADTTARTFTIPANASVAYPTGTVLTFVNQASAGVVTIAITSDTMRLAGAGTTGSRTLAANGIATALKVTATEWIISGTGLS